MGRRRQAGRRGGGSGRAATSTPAQRARRPGRGVGDRWLVAGAPGPGKLGRPLVVGINTWAGHAPGIVANVGLEPATRRSTSQAGPRREVRAHRRPGGQARRVPQRRHRHHVGHGRLLGARGLGAGRQSPKAKSILWRTGRAAATASSRSPPSVDRGSQGSRSRAPSSRRRTGCCSTCSQSGLTPRRRAVEKSMSSRRTPGGRGDVQGEQGRRRGHLGAGPLGRGRGARRRSARLVSTTAATNVIADTLVARQDLSTAPGTSAASSTAGSRASSMMKRTRPAQRGDWRCAQARQRDSVGDALGPQAHAVRRQRPVLRPHRRQGALRDALRHGVRDLAQEGAGHARRSTPRTGPTPASCRRWRRLPGTAGRGAEAAAKALGQRPGDHQQADPDRLHARLGRDHGRLVHRSTRSARR